MAIGETLRPERTKDLSSVFSIKIEKTLLSTPSHSGRRAGISGLAELISTGNEKTQFYTIFNLISSASLIRKLSR